MIHKKWPGLFVALEGPDAAGKHTQAEMLADVYKTNGEQVMEVSFPRYKTTLGEEILSHLKGYSAYRYEHSIDSSDHNIDGETVYRRSPQDLLVFQCMMTSDKYEAAPSILAHLNKGGTVISDRWWPSGYCYGTADGLPGDWLRSVHEMLPEPDVHILFSVPLKEAIHRRPEARDRYEKDKEKLLKVRELYEQLWAEKGAQNFWRVVDGVGEIRDVHTAVQHHIEEFKETRQRYINCRFGD